MDFSFGVSSWCLCSFTSAKRTSDNSTEQCTITSIGYSPPVTFQAFFAVMQNIFLSPFLLPKTKTALLAPKVSQSS